MVRLIEAVNHETRLIGGNRQGIAFRPVLGGCYFVGPGSIPLLQGPGGIDSQVGITADNTCL